jgi:phage/plasmid-associated DNA primase
LYGEPIWQTSGAETAMMLQVCTLLALAVKLVQVVSAAREWNENRIKQPTSGDPLTARFMRQDLFTFVPTHKLFIVGNNQPNLTKVDDAARRRFQMIPSEDHRPDKLRENFAASIVPFCAG